MVTTIFCSGYVLTDTGFVQKDIWVRDNLIIDPSEVIGDDVQIVDCTNSFVSAGLIDLKINGIFNIDFTSIKDPQEIIRTCEFLPPIGVTSFCASISPCDKEAYKGIIDMFRKAKRIMDTGSDHKVFAKLMGIYIDGPFQNSAKDNTRQWSGPISVEILESYFGVDNWDIIKIVGIAPELEGAVKVIQYLTEKGVMVSLSHTRCTIEEAESAVNAGATLIGHLFNGMPNFHHRDPSLVGILASDKIQAPIHYGLIADIVHTHPASLMMAQKVHEEGLMLISDFASTSEGAREVKSPGTGDGIAIYKRGTDSLIGSCTPLLECCKNFVYVTGINVANGLHACTARPANAMGWKNQGKLDVGNQADIVIFDRHLNINRVYIDGTRVNLHLQKPTDHEGLYDIHRRALLNRRIDIAVEAYGEPPNADPIVSVLMHNT